MRVLRLPWNSNRASRKKSRCRCAFFFRRTATTIFLTNLHLLSQRKETLWNASMQQLERSYQALFAQWKSVALMLFLVLFQLSVLFLSSTRNSCAGTRASNTFGERVWKATERDGDRARQFEETGGYDGVTACSVAKTTRGYVGGCRGKKIQSSGRERGTGGSPVGSAASLHDAYS